MVERKTNKLGRWCEEETVGRALRGVAPRVFESMTETCPRREETREETRSGKTKFYEEAEDGTRIERRGGRTDGKPCDGKREQETPKDGSLICLWRGSRSGMVN